MSADESVVVVSGARTPIGTYAGSLKSTPTHELGAIAIREAVKRAGIALDEVDEVVLGCVGQVGSEAYNARLATLAAGLPVSTPAFNVNRLCGSGLQAIRTAAAEILLGEADIVVAGGNENMSMQPFLDFGARDGYRLGNRTIIDGTLSLITDPWGGYPMGVTAENVARKFGIGRSEQDHFALRSQRLASAAVEGGTFDPEIVPVSVPDGKGERVFARDEHPRPGTTIEKLAGLAPAFMNDGTVTAGNASGINDGGAALVLMRESEARRRNLPILGRFVAFAKATIEPELMGYAPTYAIGKALAAARIAPSSLGVIELNEAFAAQALAVIRDADLDPDIVNPHGGAIALGHPIGATGAILTLKLLYEMQRRAAEWGLVTMCIGGGQALAAVFQLAVQRPPLK
jgi:acetyl-CoA C-acetyltransferase